VTNRHRAIPWLRTRLPGHWEVKRLKYVSRETRERNGDRADLAMLSVSEYRGVVPREYESDHQRRTTEELRDYRVVRVDQLALNTMWLNHRGLGVSAHLGVISPAYRVYSLARDWVPRFAHHLLRIDEYVQEYTRLAYGIRPNSLQVSAEDFGALLVPVPPRDEQHRIADFLDSKTAAIDQLIQKKEHLIELLQEKRQALITQAVTKGLDPSVPMKASGVEWLGEIPAHWHTAQLRHVLREPPRNGISPPTSHSGSRPTFSIAAVRAGRVRVAEHLKFAEVDAASARPFLVRRGDVLVMRGSGSIGYVGTCGLVDEEPPEGCIYPDILIRIRPNNRLVSEYLVRVLNAQSIRPQVETAARTAAGIWKISGGSLSALRLPLPPLEEQLSIARQVEESEARHSSVVSRVEQQVERLQEYRQALISAAVTGQIDVTGEAA
jgi:type I restriction enzyme, S subunit